MKSSWECGSQGEMTCLTGQKRCQACWWWPGACGGCCWPPDKNSVIEEPPWPPSYLILSLSLSWPPSYLISSLFTDSQTMQCNAIPCNAMQCKTMKYKCNTIQCNTRLLPGEFPSQLCTVGPAQVSKKRVCSLQVLNVNLKFKLRALQRTLRVLRLHMGIIWAV